MSAYKQLEAIFKKRKEQYKEWQRVAVDEIRDQKNRDAIANYVQKLSWLPSKNERRLLLEMAR